MAKSSAPINDSPTLAEKVESIARQRGFFYPSGEIYGGIAGFYDYGHIGTLIKRKFENLWRKFFLSLDENFFEIETTNVMHENVFVASGHTQHFVDPVAKCKRCGTVHRADHIMEEFLHESFEGLTPEELEDLIKKHNIKCPKCKAGELGDIKPLNMMFPVRIGADGETRAFLRAETAQGPYVVFKRQFEACRKQLPLGLAAIGRVYRNEISPRNVLIRMREFTQAELQIFFDPSQLGSHPNFKEVENYQLQLFPVKDRSSGIILKVAAKDAVKKFGLPQFYVYHMAKIQQFYLEQLRIDAAAFRFRELSEEERAFYNRIHWDIELNLPSLGWKEVAGIHYRTDYDLGRHEKLSKQEMAITYNEKKFIPHVLELSFGVDRNIWSLLELNFAEEKVGKEERTVFKLPRSLASFDAAVFPLVTKDKLPEKAKEIVNLLQQTGYAVFYDEADSIGRRYRRVDEIGVPFSITVDYDSLNNEDVTIRDRDSMAQIRVPIKELCGALWKLINYKVEFEKAGKLVKAK